MSEQLIQTPCAFGENGNFLLERELGAGGMGGVYMGRDKMLDRPVAVKVMTKELGADPDFVEKIMTSSFCGFTKFHRHRFTKMKSPVVIAPFQSVSPALTNRPWISRQASVGSDHVSSLVPIVTVAKPSLRGVQRIVPVVGAVQSTTRSPVQAHLRIESGKVSHAVRSFPTVV